MVFHIWGMLATFSTVPLFFTFKRQCMICWDGAEIALRESRSRRTYFELVNQPQVCSPHDDSPPLCQQLKQLLGERGMWDVEILPTRRVGLLLSIARGSEDRALSYFLVRPQAQQLS